MEQASVVKLFFYPSELELLRIFPEAKAVIPKKIDDWTRVKGKIFCKEIMPNLEKIAKVEDSFSRWFWFRVFVSCYLPERYKQATKNLERLRNLKFLAEDSRYRDRREDLEHSKEIAKQVPIASLYSFQKIRKAGSRLTALCPFHNEKTPSFVIYSDNTFHCFGCQAHGDSIEFVKLLKDCDFKEAVSSLAGVAE